MILVGSDRLLVASMLATFCSISTLIAEIPYVFTQPAAPVRSNTATMNGMVVPRGVPTAAWFEWGRDKSYGNLTAPQDVGAGHATVRVRAQISDLLVGEVVHYRLVASNEFGVVFGFDDVLTTGARLAAWSISFYGFNPGPIIANAVAVACGHGHGLVLRNDGTATAWFVPLRYSYPQYGQEQVPIDLTNAVALAGGYSHSLALREDGTVVSWGKYRSGSAAATPSNLSNVIAIAASDDYSFALKADGIVTRWSRWTATTLQASNVVAISAGATHCLALKADGTVAAFYESTQVPPVGLTNVVRISTETFHNLALRADGTVIAWGWAFSPTNVPPDLRDVTAISAGQHHSIVITNGGLPVFWVDHSDLGSTYSVPPDVREVLQLASGDYFTLALCSANFAPFSAYPLRTTFPMDKDAVIPFTTIEPNNEPITFRVWSLPTNGSLFQYMAEGRGDLITNPGTDLLDPAGRVIYRPNAGVSGVAADYFIVTATDGEMESAPASALLNISPMPVIQVADRYLQGTNICLNLQFTGLTDFRYYVQLSADLTNWTTLTSTQSVVQPVSITIALPTNKPRQFLRLYR